MTDRVRGALFSILGDAVPERPFFDVFAGSGAVGLEALSRGASFVTFVEKDARPVEELIRNLDRLGVASRARVLRADAYRWADRWSGPAEPVNVFLGPPYQEFVRHPDAIGWLIDTLQGRVAPASVIIVQSERAVPEKLASAESWDVRQYGRTRLALWTKPLPSALPNWTPELKP
jgi:16S rRNA (guanine(966)-N(2))-methyltransferase RsmD